MAQAASFSVILEAQNNLKAVLRQANGMIQQSTNELKKASAAQSKMGSVIDEVKAKVFSFRGGLVALGSAAVAAARPLFDFAMEGAKLADQLDFVGDRVANMDELMARTREATGGMVDDAQITKGIALMDSFGLERDKMPDLYEQAAKASLRTGDSMDQLLDSAVRGIARLSPRIIDNMGIQVELSEATQVAADRFGVEAKAIDETQKKAGLLSVVLRELGKLNKDVNLNRSRVASMKSLSTAFTNFKNQMAQDWANLFTSTGEKLDKFAHMSSVALNRANTNWTKTNKTILDGLKAIGKAENDLAELQLSRSREVQLRRQLEIETNASQRRAAADEARIRAEFQGAIDAQFWTDEKGRQIIKEGHQKELQRLIEERSKAMVAAGQAEEALLQSNITTAKAAFKEQKARDDAELKAMEEREKLIAGVSQSRIDLANKEAKLAELRAKNDIADKAAREKLIQEIDGINNMHKVTENVTKGVGRASKDNTQELRAQIEAIERKNKIAAEGDPRRKAELKSGFVLLDMLKDSEKYQEKGLEKQFLKAQFTALELQYKQDIDAIDADDAEARFRIDMAQHEVDLLKETTEEHRIQLGLDAQIAEIKHTTLEGEERRLLIKAAEIEAATRLRDLEQERLEANMATLGEGIGDAFSEGAGFLQQIDRDLSALNRKERFTNVIAGFQAMSASIPEASKKFAELGKTSLTAGEKVAGGLAAGLGAIAPSVAGFVSGTKEKAAIMAAFELAMGFATIMTPWESAAHFAAAAMFGAIAGTAASMPNTAIPEEETAGASSLITPAAEGPREEAPASFTINLGPGTIFGLPQEMGAQIAERINSMSGSGFEESTSF